MFGRRCRGNAYRKKSIAWGGDARGKYPAFQTLRFFPSVSMASFSAREIPPLGGERFRRERAGQSLLDAAFLLDIVNGLNCAFPSGNNRPRNVEIGI